MWNFSLGHSSHSRIPSLHIIFYFIPVDNKDVCDVCHYARQRKLPYIVSTNKVLHPYHMIHYDIWDPLTVKSFHGHSYFPNVVYDYNRYAWITLMKC